MDSSRFDIASGLRCKPGDMAMVIKPIYATCHRKDSKIVVPFGTYVTCVKPLLGDNSVIAASLSGKIHSHMKHPAWEIDTPIPFCVRFGNGNIVEGTILGIEDNRLLPIKPKGGFKETQAEVPAKNLTKFVTKQVEKLKELFSVD